MMIHKLMGAMAAVALMAGLGQPALAQGKGETLKIQDYPGVGNMLTRVAIAKDFCKARGITCQLQMIPTGPLGGAAMLAKSIDVGFFPPEVQISAMLKGAQMKAVASGATLNVFLIVVRNDIEVPNAAKGAPDFLVDLKGKKIGVPSLGSAGFHMLRMWMEEQYKVNADVAAGDFQFVETAPSALITGLETNRFDAGTMLYSQAYRAREDKSFRAVATPARAWSST